MENKVRKKIFNLFSLNTNLMFMKKWMKQSNLERKGRDELIENLVLYVRMRKLI